MTLPRYVSLTVAAKQRGLSVAELKRQIASGTIEAITLNGEIAVIEVKENNRANWHVTAMPATPSTATHPTSTLRAPTRADFAELAGPEHAITINEASDLLKAGDWELPHVPVPTIRQWITREYIKVHIPGYGMKVDAADVALCKAIGQYRLKKYGALGGQPLFKDGEPNLELRWPELAAYRREYRERKRKASAHQAK